jgi:glyoxylate reductase
MAKPKILVSRKLPEAVEKRLSEKFDPTFNHEDIPMDEMALSKAMQNYDAIVPTVTDKLSAVAFEVENIKTKVIGNFGVGVSHIDLDAAKNIGITVTNTPDVLSDCTADLAITLMLMLARRAGEGERELRSGNWSGWRPTHMMGQKLIGKTLGIIGFGRIGKETAKRAHFGFGMNIIAQNRSKIPDDALDQFGAKQAGSIEDLISQSDVISLHCPGGEENRHLINTDRLALMKPTAYLINTARGEVVDEVALSQALSSGSIAGAGLDVFDGEPNICDELLAAPNTVLLPHLGSATVETREAMGMRVIDNLEAFFNGQTPNDQVA